MNPVPKCLPILSSTLIGAEDNFRSIKGIWNFKLIKLKLSGSDSYHNSV
jgi:hypothetical protein